MFLDEWLNHWMKERFNLYCYFDEKASHFGIFMNALSTNEPTNERTNRPTDQPTDTTLYNRPRLGLCRSCLNVSAFLYVNWHEAITSLTGLHSQHGFEDVSRSVFRCLLWSTHFLFNEKALTLFLYSSTLYPINSHIKRQYRYTYRKIG